MATYIIGDVQGCLAALERLLIRIRFDAATDRLALAGDLVNRGPQSLETLRFLSGLGSSVTAVLGNHDVYALARMLSVVPPTPDDTLGPLVAAPDRDALIAWLVDLPALTRLVDGTVLVHAGLLPAWTVAEAQAEALAVGEALTADPPNFLRAYFDRARPDWDSNLTGIQRAAAALAVMTRIRFVNAAGRPVRGAGPPELPPSPGLLPWFGVPERRSSGIPVAFGHWAALGLWIEGDVLALDSGCVWHGALTALRLEDRAVFSVPTRVDAD